MDAAYDVDASPPSARKPTPETVETLKRLVAAEARLLAAFRSVAAERVQGRDERADIDRALNSDYVFHVARFFFLMGALGCEEERALAAFIDGHNANVEAFAASSARATRSPSELAKARFSAQRKEDVLATTRLAGRLALARGEIADLLFDHGSRNRIVDAVKTLESAGLLTPFADDPNGYKAPRPHRAVVRSDGRLEALYEAYLLDVGGGA
ncbi:MAG: hypothetical protein AAGF90_12920 [Pseudomonadota bacterium]